MVCLMLSSSMIVLSVERWLLPWCFWCFYWSEEGCGKRIDECDNQLPITLRHFSLSLSECQRALRPFTSAVMSLRQIAACCPRFTLSFTHSGGEQMSLWMCSFEKQVHRDKKIIYSKGCWLHLDMNASVGATAIYIAPKNRHSSP